MDNEFLSIYKDKVRSTLISNYVLVSKKLEMSGMEKEIREAVESTFTKDLNGGDEQGGLVSGGGSNASIDDNYDVFEFLTLSLISGYYGLTNIDFNASSLANFGFDGCQHFITTIFRSIQGSNYKNLDSSNTAFNSIVAKCRSGVGVNSYISERLYMDDIKHILRCIDTESYPEYLDKESEKLILDKLGGVIHIALSDLKNIYSSIMEDAFGLEKYAGIFTFNRKFGVQGIDVSGSMITVSPNGVLTDYFAEPLIKNYPVFSPATGVVTGEGDVYRYSDRQFNYSAIARAYNSTGSNPKPVYFPHKVLEIINGLKYTYNIQAQVYQNIDEGKNLDTYLKYLCGNKSNAYDSDDYDILPPMGKEIMRALTYCLKSFLDSHPDKSLTLFDVLDNRDMCDLSVEFIRKAEDFLSYCVKCYTTCFLLTQIESKKDHIFDFRIRVSYPFSTEYNNLNYIADVGGDGKYKVEPLISANAENISQYRLATIRYESYLQDFAYCSNPKLAYGTPLFAYKALNKMIEQKRQINWSNILLGKTEKGALVTSSS